LNDYALDCPIFVRVYKLCGELSILLLNGIYKLT
jgi:hypothetical protein